jgi:hypothetical protein
MRRLLIFLVLLAGLGAIGAAQARPSNKWRLECSGNAESSGAIVLRLAPRGAEAVEVTVEIPRRTGENHVARMIRDALKTDPRAAARWRVEVDDGEDVLVKKRRGQPDFDLEVVGNTVRGVRLVRDRE